MSDPIRKTIIEQQAEDRVRTTVIKTSADQGAPVENPRQTMIEPPAAPTAAERRATVLERPEPPPAAVSGKAPPLLFRSLVRPPMAMLTAFDDGSPEDGETWRLRRSRTTIGRKDCDIEIPHDPDVSAEHAEIVRREHDGGHEWHLIDLSSTNGTFVRVHRMILRNGREILLGGRRFVFKCQDTIPVSGSPDADPARATQQQAGPRPGQMLRLGARLVEQTAQRHGCEFALGESKAKIGRDADRCDVYIDDPFMDDVHAEVFQDKQKRWVIKDQDSLNGVWVRVPNKLLDPGTQFLLGGQRFRFDSL